MSKKDVKAEVRERRCLESLTRTALLNIVEGVLTVMWPPGNIGRPWTSDTHEQVLLAVGPNLVDEWVDEVERETAHDQPIGSREARRELSATVDLRERESMRRWADEMRSALAIADGVIRDALRPLGKRELGRALHSGRYADAHATAVALLAQLEEGIR